MVKPSIAEIDTRLKAMEEKVEYINKVVIRGNGRKSLVEEVHEVYEFMTNQKEDYKYWSRLVIGAVIVQVAGVFSAVGVFIFRILPALQQIEKLQSLLK